MTLLICYTIDDWYWRWRIVVDEARPVVVMMTSDWWYLLLLIDIVGIVGGGQVLWHCCCDWLFLVLLLTPTDVLDDVVLLWGGRPDEHYSVVGILMVMMIVGVGIHWWWRWWPMVLMIIIIVDGNYGIWLYMMIKLCWFCYIVDDWWVLLAGCYYNSPTATSFTTVTRLPSCVVWYCEEEWPVTEDHAGNSCSDYLILVPLVRWLLVILDWAAWCDLTLLPCIVDGMMMIFPLMMIWRRCATVVTIGWLYYDDGDDGGEGAIVGLVYSDRDRYLQFEERLPLIDWCVVLLFYYCWMVVVLTLFSVDLLFPGIVIIVLMTGLLHIGVVNCYCWWPNWWYCYWLW